MKNLSKCNIIWLIKLKKELLKYNSYQTVNKSTSYKRRWTIKTKYQNKAFILGTAAIGYIVHVAALLGIG